MKQSYNLRRGFMIGEDIPELNRRSAAFYSNGDTCSCNTPLNNRLNVLGTSDVRAFTEAWWDSQGFCGRCAVWPARRFGAVYRG